MCDAAVRQFVRALNRLDIAITGVFDRLAQCILGGPL